MSARAVEVKVGTPTGRCNRVECAWTLHCAHRPMRWERVGWAADCDDHEDFQPDVEPTRQTAREQAWAHNREYHRPAPSGEAAEPTTTDGA